MEACSTAVPEIVADMVPFALPAPMPLVERPYVRAAFLGLAFSVAFSSSFVIGFYWVGPVIEQARALI